MKKLMVLFTALLFLLASCSSKSSDKKYPYIFFEKNNVLMKADVNTGKASSICADPLCKHGSECPFNKPASIGYQLVVSENNDRIYYLSEKKEEHCLRGYNLLDGKVTEYFTTKNRIQNIQMIKEYLFFTEEKTDASAENSIKISTDVYRLEPEKSDKPVKLTDSPETGKIYPLFMMEDKLLWRDDTANGFFTTTLKFKDKQKVAQTPYSYQGNFNYKLSSHSNKNNPSLSGIDLNKVDQITKEEKVILSNLCGLRIADDYILYTYKLQEQQLIGKDLRTESEIKIDGECTYYNYNERKIYTSDLDGKNEKVLCELPDGYYITQLGSDYGNKKTSGDYTMIDLQKYIKNGAGEVTECTEESMILNIKTGEYHIVTY